MRQQDSQYLPAPQNPGETSSLRDILYILFLRKKVFLVFFGTVFLGVVAYTLLGPESYQSEAKVLVRVGRESLALDPTVDGPTVNLLQSREDEVNSELAMIKSRFLAEQVVDKITPAVFLAAGQNAGSAAERGFLSRVGSFLEKGWRKIVPLSKDEKEEDNSELKEAAIDNMTNSLAVGVEQKSHVITISFESKEPEFSHKVLNLFLSLYQDHHIQVHRSQAPPQFFQDQVDKLNNDLKKKENELEAFRTSHHIASIDIQKEKLFARINQIQSDIAEMNSQIAASKAHNSALEQGLAGRAREVELGRVTGRRENTTDTIKGRLFDFRVKEAELSARYPDDNRELMEVREQIRLAEAALKNEKQTDEVTTGVDPTYQAMQLALETGRAQLKGQSASLQALEGDLDKPKAELAALIKNEIIEGRMQRDVKLLEEEYVRYRQDMQRTIISKDLDSGKVSNLSIIQPATMPLEPIKPRKKLNIAVGFLLALFGGVSLVFLLEYFDDSLKTREDVENRLGLQVLASVPCEESR